MALPVSQPTISVKDVDSTQPLLAKVPTVTENRGSADIADDNSV